jgi:hypothetical protein
MTIRKMKLAYILNLPSVESANGSPWMSTDLSLADVIFTRPRYTNGCPKLLEDMRENGQRYPILVGRADEVCGHYGIDPMCMEDVTVVGDGHHRVVCALVLGWTEMDVTDDPNETGRKDEAQWECQH